MRKALSVFCGFGLFWSTALAHSQQLTPYAYRGLTPGTTTMDEFQAKMRELTSTVSKENQMYFRTDCRPPVSGTVICTSMATGLDTYYQFVDDKLASISFAFNDGLYLSGYVDGLTEKYGKPTQSVSTYQTRGGNTLTGKVWKWHNETGVIDLEENGERVGIGTLHYYDTKLSAEFSHRQPRPEL